MTAATVAVTPDFDPLTVSPIKKFSSLADYLLKNKVVKEFYIPKECSIETLSKSHSLNYINHIKNQTLDYLDSYIKECSNSILLEKYNSVKKNILSVSTEDTSRDNLQRYLTIAKLKEELLGGE